MKKTLIRAISFFLTLSLLTGLLIPFASAIEYEGVESMTVDATAALLIDDQVLYEQAADEQRYPASITKIMTALLTLEAIGRGELDLNTEITVDAAALAESMTNFGFDRALYGFEREGFSAIRDAYKARCVNLGRHVTFDGGEGTALDVDEEGRLVVQGAEGSTHVFTGEVSVHGIYGAV